MTPSGVALLLCPDKVCYEKASKNYAFSGQTRIMQGSPLVVVGGLDRVTASGFGLGEEDLDDLQVAGLGCFVKASPALRVACKNPFAAVGLEMLLHARGVAFGR